MRMIRVLNIEDTALMFRLGLGAPTHVHAVIRAGSRGDLLLGTFDVSPVYGGEPTVTTLYLVCRRRYRRLDELKAREPFQFWRGVKNAFQ